MAAPEGYNALGKIGISYKGDYDSNTTYERLDAVEHNGSTYLAIKDAPDGAPRDDKVNWIYLAKGFSGDIGDSEITFTEAENRENINTGESVKTVFGKIKKFFADLTAPAFAQMITTKEDLLATKATGYVPDAKAVADAYTELNGKLSINRIERITDNKLHNINFKNYAKITAVAIIKPQENMYLSYSFDIPTETLSAAYGYWTQGHYKTSSDTSSCVLYMNQSNIRFVEAYYCGNSVKLDSLEIYAAK